MKKTLTSLLILAITLSVRGQHGLTQESIEIPNLEITRNNGNVVQFNDPLSKIIELLGQPNLIEEYFYEMDELWAKKLKYNSCEIFTLDDKLDAFDIRTSEFKVGIDGNYISVGDNISEIANFYPLYNNWLGENYLSIPMSLGGQFQDTKLILEFDSQTKVVSRIFRYDP